MSHLGGILSGKGPSVAERHDSVDHTPKELRYRLHRPLDVSVHDALHHDRSIRLVIDLFAHRLKFFHIADAV
jgi:hypothetical protein